MFIWVLWLFVSFVSFFVLLLLWVMREFVVCVIVLGKILIGDVFIEWYMIIFLRMIMVLLRLVGWSVL